MKQNLIVVVLCCLSTILAQQQPLIFTDKIVKIQGTKTPQIFGTETYLMCYQASETRITDGLRHFLATCLNEYGNQFLHLFLVICDDGEKSNGESNCIILKSKVNYSVSFVNSTKL